MTTKQWLSRALRIEEEIEELRDQRREEWQRLTNVTQNLTGDTIQTTKDPHKYEHLLELVELYDKLIDQRAEVKIEILTAISKSEKTIYRRILTKKYIEGKTFEVIAEEVKMSDRHVKRLHGWALVEMGGIISALE